MPRYTNPNSNHQHTAPPAGNRNKEPFPPTPPVLEDSPFFQILKRWGYRERELDSSIRVPELLAPAEIRVLAQHHLDASYHFRGFIKAGGVASSSDLDRDDYHRARFRGLTARLSEEDRAKFRELIRTRNECIETLRDPEKEPE